MAFGAGANSEIDVEIELLLAHSNRYRGAAHKNVLTKQSYTTASAKEGGTFWASTAGVAQNTKLDTS